TTAFALVREQKHARALAAARDEIRVMQIQSHAGLQLVGNKESTPQQADQTSIREDRGTVQGDARKMPAPEQIAPAKPKTSVKNGRPVRGSRTGTRSYDRFSIVHFRRLQRIGPIEISVQSVDVNGKGVNLFIRSESGQVDVKHLSQNQPVWIRGGNRQQV